MEFGENKFCDVKINYIVFLVEGFYFYSYFYRSYCK